MEEGLPWLPSVGWTYAPDQNEWDITAAGTTTLSPGTNLVRVNCAGLVTVIFSSLNPVVPAGVKPGSCSYSANHHRPLAVMLMHSTSQSSHMGQKP